MEDGDCVSCRECFIRPAHHSWNVLIWNARRLPWLWLFRDIIFQLVSVDEDLGKKRWFQVSEEQFESWSRFFSDMISGDWIHPKKGLPYIALFPATEPSFGGVNWRRRTLRPHDSLIKVKSTNYTTWIKFNLKMKLDVEGLCGALVFLWINRRRESFW